MMKKELAPGDIIKRPKQDFNWKVISELGAGAFGTVNKVMQVNEQGAPISYQEFAMKTESKTVKRQSARLKLERCVMQEFLKKEVPLREHFPELVDSGQTVTHKWIVMTLVGSSLEKLKKKNGFSRSTALQCSLQTLKAIHDFHSIGFLHRDLKPANFCIGVGARMETVFLLDFGLARRFRTTTGAIRTPRPRTKMIGTPRYCARAAHRKEELGRKDDYESWLFMLFDFLDAENGCPWKGKPREVTHEMKARVFAEPTWISSTSTVPANFVVMTEYLNSLKFESAVEFGVFRETITDYARQIHLTLKEKLDWCCPPTTESTTTTTTTRTVTVDDNVSIGSDNSDPDSSLMKSTTTRRKRSNMKSITKRNSVRTFKGK